MTKKPTFPSDRSDKFLLRLPDGMRDRIAAAAKASGRSMNAEIVARLHTAFQIEQVRNADEKFDGPFREMVRNILRETSEIREHLAGLRISSDSAAHGGKKHPKVE